MNDGSNAVDRAGTETGPGGDNRMSALFAGLVLNHTQMALLLLGRTPHPASGETIQDLDGARMLIDQLEMLEQKTRGNLDAHENQMLRESLTALRMAFVDAANAAPSRAAQPATPAAATPAAKAQPDSPAGAAPSAADPGAAVPGDAARPVPEEETRKKFTKKY
jgi:hypothetical protein